MEPLKIESFVGRVLDGRWAVGSLLGRGGMGYVFEGRQLSVDRPVAIKLIRDDVAREPALVARFFREAKVLSQLQHANVVTLYDFGEDEESGALYLVMELLRGQALSERLEQGEVLSVREVLQVLEQVLGGLGAAHGENIIHRDIKPENIFVERLASGAIQAKLLDFGIAKVDEPQMTRLTQAGCLQGTPHFMAPEQIEGKPCTPQTDLYALGVVLYEVLSGKQPFAGDTLMTVLMQHLNKAPDPLELNWMMAEPPHAKVIALVHDLLEKDPNRRPRTTDEVRARVRVILAELELAAPSTEPVVALASARLVAPEHNAPPPPDEAPPRAAASDPDARPERELGETWDGWSQPEAAASAREDDAEVAPSSGLSSGKVGLLAAVVVLLVVLVGLLGYLLTRDPEPTGTQIEPPQPGSTAARVGEGASAPVDGPASVAGDAATNNAGAEATPEGAGSDPTVEGEGPTPARARRRAGRDPALEKMLNDMRSP